MLELTESTPCFFTQQIFLIGTYDEAGGERFAPISWVSYTRGEPPCLVISISGTKQTKENIARSKLLSATVVTPDLLPFAEQCNRATYHPDKKKELRNSIEKGRLLEVPLLAGAPFSYECSVIQTVELGATHTYFAEIKKINASQEIQQLDFLDLRVINPVVYSPMNYFTIGQHLGKIGDYSQNEE